MYETIGIMERQRCVIDTAMKMFLRMIQQLLHRKSSTVFLFLLCAGVSGETAVPLPADIHQGITSVIDNIYKEDFDAAENEAKKIIRKFPEHPSGYFCMAFLFDSWMMRYQSDKKEDEFYRYCDRAIEKGEKILAHHKEDEWAKFFVGGADGYKGTYEFRYERWITSFRYGWKGVSVLLELKESGSDIPDIDYGIGCYNYWRSALMKLLWWMPGIEDKRQEGIEQLFKAKNQALYMKVTTLLSLVDILINEKRYNEALKVAEEGLAYYPNATLFMSGKARALYFLNEYEKAVDLFRKIIRKTETESFNNHYTTAMCHFYLAKIKKKKKKYVQAITECNIINNYSFEPSNSKRMDATLTEVKSINKQALQEMSKGR